MTENQIKHLEFIQANISHMNQCSFQMKGWTITIVSALLALYAASIDINTNPKGNLAFVLISIFPAILFWFLDSYYLQQERKFRGIYNEIAILNCNKITTVKDFEMPLNKYSGGEYSYISSLFSITECLLYLSIIIALLIIGIVM
nr:hypothetical protein [Sedimentibacter sp.]